MGRPAPIGGESAEDHLIGVYHKDRTLTVVLFQGLTDGRGLFFFVEELLRAYSACTSGEAYVPETTQYDDMNAEPLKSVYDVYEKSIFRRDRDGRKTVLPCTQAL